MEVIRGSIVTQVNATVEIRVPSHTARLPGWTRLESAGKVLVEIGLEVEGANRVEIRPAGDGHSLMVWHQYPGEDNRVSQVFRLGQDDQDDSD